MREKNRNSFFAPTISLAEKRVSHHNFIHVTKIILFILAGLFAVSQASADSSMEMHRLQATTTDASGWYLAESTEGTISVLIPVPFNDFTVVQDDPKFAKMRVQVVGAKTAEGIKFSATEIPAIPGKPAPDFAKMLQDWEQRGQTPTEIDHSDYAGLPSIFFHVEGTTTAAYFRCVKTATGTVMVTLEYPLDQKNLVENYRQKFFGSLKFKASSPAK